MTSALWVWTTLPRERSSRSVVVSALALVTFEEIETSMSTM